MELILGIDDAGRGPVMGPMVLAGCLIKKEIEKEFKKLGVRDSKELTQKRREFLVGKIKQKAEIFWVTITYPNEIDGNMNNGTNLNMIEAIKAAEIINKINKDATHHPNRLKIKVIVDCPSVSLVKWKDFLKTKINNLSNLDIICEHKADKNHISVSAASIIAKSVREEEVGILKKKYGEEIGSGYTSDPLTQKFLANNVEKYKDSGIFRKTWKTWKRAFEKIGQRTL